jgi:hypothetical protein
MKKLCFLAMVLFVHASIAQNSNAVFFTEKGEKFTLIMNGQRINNEPQTHVKADKLNGTPYVVKILFENTALGEINDKVYLENFKENTYSVKERKVSDSEKGLKKAGANIGRNLKNGSREENEAKKDSIDKTNSKYVIRLLSSTYLDQPTTQQPASGGQSNTTGTTSKTTTTTTTNGNAGSNSGKANVSFNVNVNATESGHQSHTHSSTTTHTTTQQEVYVMPGYDGPTGCSWPMNDGEFAELKGSIASKSFEESKLTIAKQVTTSRCMTASQVKEIAMLFDFENSKLEYAKYAYAYTFDTGNYFKVNDVFEFETSISDLNAYINSRR